MADSLDLNSAVRIQQQLIKEVEEVPGLLGELARLEGVLSETYRDRVQYELLQNSDDAAAKSVDVYLNPYGSFTWKNDGKEFTLADFEALCRSASSSKTDTDTIGYRGIGFKSLAAVGSHIEVLSGGVHFVFDRTLLPQTISRTCRGEVPLIRIPANVSEHDWTKGSEFRVSGSPSREAPFTEIEPLSLLFLRNVRSITLYKEGETTRLKKSDRSDREVVIDVNGRKACFAILRMEGVSVGVPLNEEALKLVGPRGRLSAFLPLQNEVGLPLVINGSFLTDPSRKNVVLEDEATSRILGLAGKLVADQLVSRRAHGVSRLWELILQAEDMRMLLANPALSASKIFVSSIRREMEGTVPDFVPLPIAASPADVEKIFGKGTPEFLYDSQNLLPFKRAFSAFGVPVGSIAELASSVDFKLSQDFMARAAKHLSDLLRATGKTPSRNESKVMEYGGKSLDRDSKEAETAVIKNVSDGAAANSIRSFIDSYDEPFYVYMKRWRASEVAVCEWLNGQGWSLRDVSKQNLGYDLEGTDNDGRRVMIEVKSLGSSRDRFSVTNNEMGVYSVNKGNFIFALVIGDSERVRLALLDLSKNEKVVQVDRVCRAWEWQISGWQDVVKYV